jgi:porin
VLAGGTRRGTIASAIVPLRDERGLGLFSNVGVTPWCHVTTDLQVITPVLERAETSLESGLRTEVDF